MNRRASDLKYAGPFGVHASGWVCQKSAIMLSTGDPERGGSFQIYVSSPHARDLANILIAAADHYDAETERLAQEAA